jgi:6-bladed beta-propeller
MSHSSIVISRSGAIITGATSSATLHFRDRSGATTRLIEIDGVDDDLHGITLVEEDGTELLWIADTATLLFGGQDDLDIRPLAPSGKVVQLDLNGKIVRRLEQPPHAEYASGSEYRPTRVAVDERRLGGTGDIYVADGYGASLVHLFSADGAYRTSLSGDEGAGRFNCPHDVLIDRRKSEPELYIADRKNSRILVYDLDGSFRRVVGDGVLAGPTQLATSGSTLVITDLLAGRVTLLDGDGQLITHLFPSPAPPPDWDQEPDAWPNARDADGKLIPANLQPGAFHTPHGVAIDEHGRIYVSEFAIGERVAVLDPSVGAATTP